MPLSIRNDMRFVRTARLGSAEVLQTAIKPTPRPDRGEVLIEVAAAGVNRPDVLQRSGAYPPPPGANEVLGLEVAGTVVATGPDVSTPAVGEMVCALVPGGGYAEYCITSAAHCLPVPTGLTLVEAAALPETHFTVWSNVFERGALRAGETLLVHGGSSGIGTTAIQLARSAGASVAVTAGSDEKCTRCLELGAARAINYRHEDFVEAVRDWTDNRGVDVVLDMVGGSYIPRNLDCLALDGRMVQIAFLDGPRVEADFRAMLQRRLTWTGSNLRPQSIQAKARIAQALREHVWPWIEQGLVRPLIHQQFPLAQATAAHRLMEGSTHIGKIVLIP